LNKRGRGKAYRLREKRGKKVAAPPPTKSTFCPRTVSFQKRGPTEGHLKENKKPLRMLHFRGEKGHFSKGVKGKAKSSEEEEGFRHCHEKGRKLMTSGEGPCFDVQMQETKRKEGEGRIFWADGGGRSCLSLDGTLDAALEGKGRRGRTFGGGGCLGT